MRSVKEEHRTVRENLIQLVGFYSGSRLFGADILNVREILRYPDVQPLEAGPQFIAGFIRVRGVAIPVIDLAQHIGSNFPTHSRGRPWVIVTFVQNRPVGFMVDTVTRIHRLDVDMLLPAPELILSGLRSQYIRAVCDTGKGLLMVLELDRLLVDEEVKTIQRLKLI